MDLSVGLPAPTFAGKAFGPGTAADQSAPVVTVEAAAGAAVLAPGLVITAGSVLLIGLLLAATVRVVGADQRLVVRRTGRETVVRRPGLTVVVPFRDRGVRVDLREQELDLLWIPARTGDGVAVTVSGAAAARIVDPATYVEAGAPASSVIAEVVRSQLARLVANASLTEIAAFTARDLRQVCAAVNGHLASQGIRVSDLDIDRMEIPVTADLIRWVDRMTRHCVTGGPADGRRR